MSAATRLFATVAISGATFTVCQPSRAADAPATVPAAATGPAVQSMRIVIDEVKGIVQVRANDQAPWKAAKVDMVLDEGAEFRTGPRSSVTCLIPPDQTLTLDRLGTVKIAEAIKSGNKIKTDMVMKYGRATYDIEAAGAEHESVIRSPSSTLAVRGTKVRLYDQPPFVPQADSFHGRASFRNAQRELRFGGKSLTTVANDKNSSADTALGQQVVDPRSASVRTSSEAAFIANQTSLGATFTFDRVAQIPVVRNGPGPLTDAQLQRPGALPGQLELVLRWTGNTNLNLLADDIAGQGFNSLIHFPSEILYPGYGLNTSRNGGTIPYDDRGGKNGGMEIAYFNTVTTGVYGLGAIFISGKPTNYSLSVLLNGKFQDLVTGTDDNGNPITTQQLTGTISSRNDTPATIVLIPATPSDTSAAKKANSSKATSAPKVAKTSVPSQPAPAVKASTGLRAALTRTGR